LVAAAGVFEGGPVQNGTLADVADFGQALAELIVLPFQSGERVFFHPKHIKLAVKL
jgi:hypothetical protein